MSKEKLSAEREDLFGEAVSSMPPPTQKVPRKPKTRQDKVSGYEKYGKAPPWRLPPELIEAVSVAARMQDVKPRDLAEFIIRAGLELLVIERIKLPAEANPEKPASNVLASYPAIPDQYRG